MSGKKEVQIIKVNITRCLVTESELIIFVLFFKGAEHPTVLICLNKPDLATKYWIILIGVVLVPAVTSERRTAALSFGKTVSKSPTEIKQVSTIIYLTTPHLTNNKQETTCSTCRQVSPSSAVVSGEPSYSAGGCRRPAGLPLLLSGPAAAGGSGPPPPGPAVVSSSGAARRPAPAPPCLPPPAASPPLGLLQLQDPPTHWTERAAEEQRDI